MSRKSGRPGQVRITVPLFGTHFKNVVPGDRLQITDRVILAALDEREQQRTEQIAGQAATTRFEFFGICPDFPEYASLRLGEHNDAQFKYGSKNAIHGRRALVLVDLLALTARLHPNHDSALADVWDGTVWRRVCNLVFAYRGTPDRYSMFPSSRFSAYGRLIENWPNSESAQLRLAFSYYLDSIYERQHRNPVKAFTSAAIAAEVLLDLPRTEVKRSFRQRASHLVATGSDCFAVDRVMSSLYNKRSETVHRGKEPPEDDVALLQQWLMAALPTVAAAGLAHNELIPLLDRACYDHSAVLHFHVPGSWWRLFSFAALCT